MYRIWMWVPILVCFLLFLFYSFCEFFIYTLLFFPPLQCYVSIFIVYYCIFIRTDFIKILGDLFSWPLCIGSLSVIQIPGASVECPDIDCLQCLYFRVYHISKCLWIPFFFFLPCCLFSVFITTTDTFLCANNPFLKIQNQR